MLWSSQPSPDGSGLFCVVRTAVGVATIECDGFERKRRADELAHRMNTNYQAAESRRLAAPTNPAERKIPKGFYSDKDGS